ncbi:MAG: hypothetical protein FWG10_03285 [Eubacteriaceae bacterium]|nr:hypothetical protein [Eubacteriaceae bacterium]
MAENKQALQKENFDKAINHIEPDWIPKNVSGSNAILDYAGYTFMEVEYSPELTEKVIRHFFDNIPSDTGNVSYSAFPKTYEALDNMTETFLGPDGVALQHLQRPTMKADEYPLLIADMDKFVKDTLLPRKFPSLFGADKEEAIRRLKTIIDERVWRATSHVSEIQKKLYEEYGFYPTPTVGLAPFVTPIDYIFDRLRGFVGTIADLRRRPQEVHDALEVIYAVRATDYRDTKLTGVMANYPAHIPCYLSPKQFDEFFWPYFEKQINGLASTGNKLSIFIEGHWLPFIDRFLNLPKDSLFNRVDDDDILDLNKVIGHHHTLMGGVIMQNMRLLPLQKNIDYAKQVIDEVGPGGGLVFGCNKSWLCRGDINQNVADTYKFVNEYGRK